eukprot:2822464-Pyramimonas_sp.AAC.1
MSEEKELVQNRGRQENQMMGTADDPPLSSCWNGAARRSPKAHASPDACAGLPHDVQLRDYFILENCPGTSWANFL